MTENSRKKYESNLSPLTGLSNFAAWSVKGEEDSVGEALGGFALREGEPSGKNIRKIGEWCFALFDKKSNDYWQTQFPHGGGHTEPDYVLLGDPMGYKPIFFKQTDNVVTAVSTDPALLAAACNSKVDTVSLVHDILYGFRVGTRSIFQDIKRIGFAQQIRIPNYGAAATVATPMSRGALPNNDRLGELIAFSLNAASSGAILELTGGVDSRLALALCVAGGVVPKAAFTLGDPGDADVDVAAEICRQYSIKHHVFSPAQDVSCLVDDAYAFVKASGWSSNSCSYAWLPQLFRQLENYRQGQITGAGGEIAGSFYYTPIDNFFEFLPARIWRAARMEIPGHIGRELFPQDVLRFGLEASWDWPADAFDQSGHSLRAVTDQFYREERMRQWAAPVLAASAMWYDVYAPFVSEAYLQWSGTRSGRAGPGRAGQIQLISELDPRLAAIPFGQMSNKRRRFDKARALIKKIDRRIRKSSNPDMGALITARALAESDRVRERVEELISEVGGTVREDRIRQLFEFHDRSPSAVGVLVTAANAIHERNKIRSGMLLKS